ncbi:ABC transporter ATP-binding protein [Pseudonocardia spinosispora]|uniref:ABC transporter ATP-binding protein n=1 Tax=Pseudonocardia spinosispora TaxID=103441 RepID=UPI000425779D|nr:ABC transporter ATP-binding protein [Pseudonocardia spinosispora]
MALTGPEEASRGGTAISIDGLSFAYPRGGHRVAEVSVSIHEHEVCVLLGPNGAGKTTLLRCLLGLLTPHRGQIQVLGTDIAELSARQLARRVAYVPQITTTPFPFTALDIAVMGRTPYLAATAAPTAADRRTATAQLDRLGIAHLAQRPFSLLSGGERQLTLLARALVQQAPVLVLDEPTAALDYGNEVRILGVITELARAGHCVLMTTHQPAHALTHASRAVLMRGGRLVADGRPEDVVTSDSLSDLYGVGIHVAQVNLPGENGLPVRTCIPIPSRPSPR